MTGKLKSMLNCISLPEELDENIELGFERAKKQEGLRKKKSYKVFIAVAASLIIIISSISIIGLDRVHAAIKQALQYVPGYNIVVDRKEGEVLALQEKVLYEKDDIFVKITAASKLDKNITVSVEGNYMARDTLEVFLKDKEGNIIPTIGWSRGSGSKFWQGDYTFELESKDKDYSLLVGDLEIPFTLDETTRVDDFLQLGPFAQDKGINLVAIKKSMEDKIMISLLNQSEDRLVADYPFKESIWSGAWSSPVDIEGDIEKSMYLIDKEGNKTYPTIPSAFRNLMSDFYFDTEDKEGLRLVLPYLKINYPNVKTKKIKIQRPEKGEVERIDKVLPLGKFEIHVVEVKRRGEEILISLRGNSFGDEILDRVHVRGTPGHVINLNEDTGYMELSINSKDVGKRFSIYFESPTSLLLGDWEIDLEK